MTTSSLQAKIIRVKVADKPDATGLYFATSPDMKGLIVAKTSLEEVYASIPVVIRALYLACGEHVVVSRADDTTDDLSPWVAFPAELARRELQLQA
jgi:hypothetical protein